ncbi:MAG: preprotein translocase subunit SecY [Candidatus Nomurabacteria bacterium]|jgi:preprotein translocase subunit SecY|nr:preprotein translocase subunit SecY [Candidatus Nomurabacteria bacterium]
MNWKIIFKSLKNKEMLKRVLAVLFMVVIFRLMAHIPVPLADPTQLHDILQSTLSSTQFGGFLNMLSGGALAQFSIVLVGLSPYITASIISQLLTKAIPKLEELHKDGESGRRKINQWTRIISLPLAILQSIAFVFILRQTVLQGDVLADMDMFQWIIAVTAMSAGSIILMWLGEIITEKGIGNGISLLIFGGIISQLPNTLASVWQGLTTVGDGEALNVFNWFTLPINAEMFYIVGVVLVLALLVLYFLVKINEAQRIVTINYAKRVRGNTAYSGVKSILPIKMITAGVIPVIFAVAFLALPAFVGQLLIATGNEAYKDIGQNLVTWFQSPSAATVVAYDMFSWTNLIYPLSYFVLVILFTYFYTSIVFNANEISENLQKQGGFIEGVRPGKQTEKYLRRTVNRLTLFGSIALGIIAVLPFVFEYGLAFMGFSGINLAIGGTGLLIVVSVALESLRQINSRALMVTYDEFE